VLLLLSARPPGAPAQSDQRIWALKTDRYIILHRLAPAGVLIVSTDSALVGVDTSTGNVLWSRADIPNSVPSAPEPPPASSFGTADRPPVTPRVTLSPVWGTPYVIVARDSADSRAWVEVIDARAGNRRWVSDSLLVADVHGYAQLPDSALLLYGRSGSGPAAKMVFMAVDAGTGTPRWRSDTWFSEPPVEYDTDGLEADRGTLDGNQWPLFDTDTTAILVWSPQGPVKVNMRTGERLWAASARLGKPPALAHGYPPPLLADGVAYIPFERRLAAVRALDGRPRWPEPRKFGGRIVQMEMTPRGLLVRGGPDWDPQQARRGFALRGPQPGGKRFLDLLDPATGESRWLKREKPIEVSTPFVRAGENVYAATREKLYRIALEGGEAHELASFKFRAGERPDGLELRGTTLVVLSAHTLTAFDTAGRQVYDAFFAPPGPSTLARLAVLGANVASLASAVANQGYYPFYSLQRRDSPRPPSQDYAYVVVAHADSAGTGPPGLLKVDKDTGKPVRRLLVGRKWPVYEMNAAETLIFFQADDHEIDCYRF